MSSGGGKTQTTTQTNDPPAWAVPYFQQGLEKASGVANQNYQAYGGQRVAGFTQDQQMAQDATRNRAMYGSQALQGANNYVNSTLAGGPNPYTDEMVNQVTGDISRNFRDATAPNMMAQFNSAGAYGGSAQQQAMQGAQGAMADSIGQAATSIRSGAYEADQNRKMQAAQFAPQLAREDYYDMDRLGLQGSQQQNLWQSLLDSQYGDFTEQRDWSKNQLSSLSNMLGAIQGGTQTSTGANPNYTSGTQNAMSYAALLASMYGN